MLKTASAYVPCVLLLFLNHAVAAPTEILTMSFRQPEQIQVNNRSIELGSHVTTRLFDLDKDGVMDLLVADGQGNLRAYGGTRSKSGVVFQTPISLQAGAKTKWGSSYTGLALANIAGNEAEDLIVAHSGNKISIHTRIGKVRLPDFSEQSIEFHVQDNCCLLYTSPSPRDQRGSRMPSSA